ncbi:hypothetical protein INR49_005545 [Caranx melampygus]|nr:hypothetical protein INR49_005545 [Caranx melampygus]
MCLLADSHDDVIRHDENKTCLESQTYCCSELSEPRIIRPLRDNEVNVGRRHNTNGSVIITGSDDDDDDDDDDICSSLPLQLHGVMRVVMEPLLGDMPLIGALSVFFLKKPPSSLEFMWIGGLAQRYCSR